MKVLHINAGNETGGGKVHLLSLLSQFIEKEVELLTFEEGEISKEASKLGIKTKVLDQKNQFDITVVNSLITYINTGKFDVIHTHGPRANLYLRMIKKDINVKWVVTVHSDPSLDFIAQGFKGRFFSYLNIQSILAADKIICVSSKIKEKLIQKGASKLKLKTIHNGIKFPNTTESNRFNKVFTITHIARLHPIKRHAYLLECFKKSKINNYIINIIGDGELLESLKETVNFLEMEDHVVFHGHLTKDGINSLLLNSDLSVLSSLSETFPLVLLESASQKVPFISTDVGDVRTMDPQQDFSWIVSIDDQEEFVTAILDAYELWKKDKLFIKGEQAFKYMSESFTLEKMASNTWDTYLSLFDL